MSPAWLLPCSFPDAGKQTGRSFSTARRGWLYPVTPNNLAAVKSFDKHGWNRYHVEAIGNRIRTWINGVPVEDLVDDADASGFIGFQVHAVVKELAGTRVQWKDIMIVTENLEKYMIADTTVIYQAYYNPNTLTEREISEGWQLLFDGATSAGWRGAHLKEFPESGWVIENWYLKVLASGGAESNAGGKGPHPATGSRQRDLVPLYQDTGTVVQSAQSVVSRQSAVKTNRQSAVSSRQSPVVIC